MTELYSISDPSHFDGIVPNTTQLKLEIIDSSITTSLDRIDRSDGYIYIVFESGISGAERITLNGLVSNHQARVTIGKALQHMDALVSADGDGDFLLPSEAFNAGAVTIFIKHGTYYETGDVILPDGGSIIG